MNPFRAGLFLLAIICLASQSTGAEGQRVVSQTVGTDELLLALAEEGQIAALSHLSRDPDFSAIAREANGFPVLRANGDAENILQYDPTLVLFADYSRHELVEQIRRTGVQVMIFENYGTLEETYANLEHLAGALEQEARATELIGTCRTRVKALNRALAGRSPIRVIAPSTYGVIAGAETTFQDLCDHSGAVNLAATLGGLVGHVPPPNERMLLWPIEVIVISGDSFAAAIGPYRQLPPYSLMEVVREGRAVVLKPWQLGCVSHYRIDAYERLARELHPEAFD